MSVAARTPSFLKVAIGTGAVFVAAISVALILSTIGRKPEPSTLSEHFASLDTQERAALGRICADAQIALEQITLIRVWPLEISTTPLAIAFAEGHVRALRISGTSFSDTSAVVALSAMESLWLDRNRITTLTSLNALQNLRELNVRGNQLTSLGRLPAGLTVFDGGDNQLVSLEGIESASSLQQLFLGGNRITSVESLAGLPALAEVDLDRNQLVSIDPLFKALTLRRLYVRGNRLAARPPQLIRNGFLEVFAD